MPCRRPARPHPRLAARWRLSLRSEPGLPWGRSSTTTATGTTAAFTVHPRLEAVHPHLEGAHRRQEEVPARPEEAHRPVLRREAAGHVRQAEAVLQLPQACRRVPVRPVVKVAGADKSGSQIRAA